MGERGRVSHARVCVSCFKFRQVRRHHIPKVFFQVKAESIFLSSTILIKVIVPLVYSIIEPWANSLEGSKIIIGNNLIKHFNTTITDACSAADITFVSPPKEIIDVSFIHKLIDSYLVGKQLFTYIYLLVYYIHMRK